jgi:hypothetical protein
MAPSPCWISASATNEALCPPTQITDDGSQTFAAFAKSTISGTLAR